MGYTAVRIYLLGAKRFLILKAHKAPKHIDAHIGKARIRVRENNAGDSCF